MSERETLEPRETTPPTSDEVREIRERHEDDALWIVVAKGFIDGRAANDVLIEFQQDRATLLVRLTQKDAEIERVKATLAAQEEAAVELLTGKDVELRAIQSRLSAAESRIAADGRELEGLRKAEADKVRCIALIILAVGGKVAVSDNDIAKYDGDKLELVRYRDEAAASEVFEVRARAELKEK